MKNADPSESHASLSCSRICENAARTRKISSLSTQTPAISLELFACVAVDRGMVADGVSIWLLIPAVIVVYVLLANLGRVRTADAKRMIAEGATLLDVRSPEEVQGSGIAGAINVPVQLVGPGIRETLPDPEQPILCFCLSGSRSSTAVGRLKRLGFRAYNVGGVGRMRRLLETS